MQNRISRFILFLCLLSTVQLAEAQYSILFSREKGALNTGDTPDLMMIDPTTGKEKVLIKGTVARRGESNPAVSPDGKKIIFQTYRYRGWKLAIADYQEGKASNVKRFTSRPNYESDPDWSHDGNQVLFTEYNWGTDKSGLFVMDQQTGKVKEVETGRGGIFTPGWSQDDQSIVFASEINGNTDVYSVSTNGTGKKNLTNHASHDMASSVSPITNDIAFISNRNGRLHLYTMNSAGKDVKNLTPDLKSDAFTFTNWQESNSWGYKTSWSPDGRQIVFNMMINKTLELFVVNVDGTGLKQLTHNKDADFAPHWVK